MKELRLRKRLGLAAVGVFLALTLPASESVRRTLWREDDYWLKRYQEICTWDTRCVNLRPGLDWASPSTIISEVLRGLSPTLLAVARLYDIDPNALAGVLLAENSMNVTPFDKLQNILAESKVLPTGQFLGHSFTLGLGQINEPAASQVEPLASRIEGRTRLRTREEITRLILTPGGAICYAAAILRDSQDAYEEVGLSVRRRPGVLATLYNLGYPREFAAARKAKGGAPQVNAFGLFIEMYRAEIAALLQPEGQPQGRPLPESPCPKDL